MRAARRSGRPWRPWAAAWTAATRPCARSARCLAFIPGVFERLRTEFGADLHLLHDAHHRLTPIQAARLRRDLESARLFFHSADAPGLGVDIDEAEADKHPYRRAYLPVARLADGTVHDW